MVASRQKRPSGYDIGILHRRGLFVFLFSLQTARLWRREILRPANPCGTCHFSEGADRGFDSISGNFCFSLAASRFPRCKKTSSVCQRGGIPSGSGVLVWLGPAARRPGIFLEADHRRKFPNCRRHLWTTPAHLLLLSRCSLEHIALEYLLSCHSAIHLPPTQPIGRRSAFVSFDLVRLCIYFFHALIGKKGRLSPPSIPGRRADFWRLVEQTRRRPGSEQRARARHHRSTGFRLPAFVRDHFALLCRKLRVGESSSR